MSVGLRQFHATLLLHLAMDECCGRKKLPFAEYSVVKDQPGGTRPSVLRWSSGLAPWTPSKSRLTSAGDRTMPTLVRAGAGRRSQPTSARAGEPVSAEAAELTCVATPTQRQRRPASFARRNFFKERPTETLQPAFAHLRRWLATRSSFAFRRQPAFVKAAAGNLRVHSSAKVGGEYRARTGDLLVANQALSQLS